MPEIRFLEPRDIRTVWKREDRNFTPWLASSDPLSRLLAECFIDIGDNPVIQTEVKIPGIGRSLDILVQLENGERIAIENQYAEGDHDHLTRALAYAVGLETRTVIVVAESHRPEFVEVVRYLNAAGLSYGEHGIRVFLVNVGVVGLTNSDTVYPTFEATAVPDEWKAATTRLERGQSPEKDALIYDFHDKMLPLMREATGIFRNVTPTSNSWKSGGLGIGGVSVTYGANKESTYIQIWFSKVNSPEVNHAGYDALEKHREDINKELDRFDVSWRKSKATAIIEVMIDGIGYGTELDINLMKLVAQVAHKMTEIIKRYRAEISNAMANGIN